MLIRVWGEINGVGSMPIVAIEDRYYFKPPQTLTGRYVCQFWAEDDYGNIGYNSAILYIQDGIVKCIEVLSRDWSITMLGDPWGTSEDYDHYAISHIPTFAAEAVADGWEITMVPITCKRDMLEVL